MTKSEEVYRPDFEQAMGETFGEFVSPPIPFEYASPHDCCEVVWQIAGAEVTPTQLRDLSEEQIGLLAQEFGEYFECLSPTIQQIKDAIAHTLARWPPGSLGEPT